MNQYGILLKRSFYVYTTTPLQQHQQLNQQQQQQQPHKSCLKLLNFMHFVGTSSSPATAQRLLNFFIIRQFFYCHKKKVWEIA